MNYRQSGFSLLELMVALLLVGILTSVAVPGYRSMVQNNKISSATTTLVTAINYARSEASKRNASIYICSGDRSSTNPVCATGSTSNNWSEYIIVFYDGDSNRLINNLDGNYCTDLSRDCIIQTFDGASLPGGATQVIFRGDASNTLRIRSDGSSDTPSTLYLCDQRGAAYGREITVGISGRPRVLSPAGGCS